MDSKHLELADWASTSLSARVPWALWQSEHFILPSRMGWWDWRSNSARMLLWHCRQVSSWLW